MRGIAQTNRRIQRAQILNNGSFPNDLLYEVFCFLIHQNVKICNYETKLDTMIIGFR